MAAIKAKLSDMLLDIELFFGRFRKKKPVQQQTAVGQVVEEKKVQPIEKLPWSLRFLSLSRKQRLFFYDQMSTLIGSGVTLIDSLNIIQAQSNKKPLKQLYGEMIHRINGGMGLAETMYLFPHLFPSMQAALVEAGEKSGNLREVMTEIVDDLENQQDFYRKIKGAMFYPVVLIFLAMAMVTGMMIFVIPKVAELYEQSNAELPALTQTVIDISGFVSSHWIPLILAIIGGLVAVVILVKKTKPGRFLWEKFVWLIPVFGSINKEKNIMMFASNLSMLLKSGVLISDAFEISEKTIDNLHYRKALSEIRHGIILGKNVSELMGLEDIKKQIFRKNKLFPLQVAQMFHIGEVTGTIAEMSQKIRDNFKKSIDYKLKNISTMIEPLMIFFVALLVGSVLLAVMLPFFYIGTTIS